MAPWNGPNEGIYERHLANTTEQSVYGDDAVRSYYYFSNLLRDFFLVSVAIDYADG